MEITRGIIRGAKKVLIYGPEGIGKTTFASKFPDPLFIDTEGSTKELDVARLPAPSSWTILKEEVRYVIQNPGVCRTLVIDTADWAERMAIKAVLDEHSKNGIEDFGYGNGYRYVYEKFGELLNLLTEVIDKGINVVLTAHATLRKFEQPDEMGAYDRYTMKLIDSPKTSISAAIKEWSDMVLFANYRTIVVTNSKTKKTKAQGGARVLYTTHHSCWDAKNRFDLPEEIPFEYDRIRHVIEGSSAPATPEKKPAKANPAPAPSPAPALKPDTAQELPPKSSPKPEPEKKGAPAPRPKSYQQDAEEHPITDADLDKRIPKDLRDLMLHDNIGEWDVENFVCAKGWMPHDAKIFEYESITPGFVAGALVAQWDKVRDMIRQARREQEIPFN